MARLVTLQEFMAQGNMGIEEIIVNFAGDLCYAVQPIGVASGVTVCRVKSHPPDDKPPFAMKLVNLDQEEYTKLNQEVTETGLIAHRNIVGMVGSFIYGGIFTFAMPYMDRGSLRSIMSFQFPYGLPEECIAVALRESLIGLSFLHGEGKLHKDINAGHIFLNQNPAVKLGYAATIYEHNGNDQASSSSVLPATTICTWAAAPEVYKSNNVYTPKADIWLIGITALELGYGGLRLDSRAALEIMIVKMIKEKRLPKKDEGETSTEKEKSKKLVDRGKEKTKKLVDLGKRLLSGEWKKRTFSKAFEKMVIKCLAWNPAERPTADQLLQNRFFRKARDVSYIERVIG